METTVSIYFTEVWQSLALQQLTFVGLEKNLMPHLQCQHLFRTLKST